MKQKIELTSEELEKLKSIELEMLIELDRICRKYNIEYSIDGGTLLGAVRHKGFIPWDDDIDVIMLRSEYEKFAQICKTELDKDRFFLQDYTTDKNYLFGYEKLRRNNTKFMRIGQEHIKQHSGIFIDIFVADNVPDNYILRNIHCFLCFCIRKILYARIACTATENVMLRLWYKLLACIPRDFAFWCRNLLAGACNKRRTELVRHMTHYYRKASRYGVPRDCFDNFEDVEFEGRKFRGFVNRDKYLKVVYGDYMTLPPVEKRKPHLDISEIQFTEPEL